MLFFHHTHHITLMYMLNIQTNMSSKRIITINKLYKQIKRIKT